MVDFRDLIWAVSSKSQFPSTEEKNRIISGMKWIGLFSDTPITPRGNPLDTLCATLEDKMQYEEGERDMCILQHKFLVEYKDGKKVKSPVPLVHLHCLQLTYTRKRLLLQFLTTVIQKVTQVWPN